MAVMLDAKWFRQNHDHIYMTYHTYNTTTVTPVSLTQANIQDRNLPSQLQLISLLILWPSSWQTVQTQTLRKRCLLLIKIILALAPNDKTLPLPLTFFNANSSSVSSIRPTESKNCVSIVLAILLVLENKSSASSQTGEIKLTTMPFRKTFSVIHASHAITLNLE